MAFLPVRQLQINMRWTISLSASARDILRDVEEGTGDRARSQIGSCRYNIRPETLSLRVKTSGKIHVRTLLHTSFLADRQRIEHPDRRLVSGNIIGMILLFAALCMRWVKAETVRPAAKFLLGAMALFFVPYGVGLMDSYRVILDNLWAIVISGIVSTIVVLLVTGQTFQSLNRRSRLRRIRHLRETAPNAPDHD